MLPLAIALLENYSSVDSTHTYTHTHTRDGLLTSTYICNPDYTFVTKTLLTNYVPPVQIWRYFQQHNTQDRRFE